MNKNFKHKSTKHYKFIWTAVLGLAILFASGCSQLPYTQDRGLKLLQEGNIEGAINYYDKVIEHDPEQSSFYYNRGLAWQMKEDYERALEDYSTAIRLDSEFTSAYLNRGLIRYHLGDLEGAIQDYNRVLELDSGNVTAYNRRGCIRIDWGYYEDAILDFTSILEVNPDHITALSNRAYAYQCLDEFTSAIEDYTQLLQKDPGNAQAYNNRGSIKMKMDDISGAWSDFNKAASIDPSYAKAFYNRAVTWMKLADYQRALFDLEKAALLDENLKSEVQGYLKTCRDKIELNPEARETDPQSQSIQMPEIQNETLAVNIEVPVRVFKDGVFADNLTIDDFMVYEDGKPQKIEAVYLIKKTSINRKELKIKISDPMVASRHFVFFFEVVEYIPEIGDSLDYFFNSILNPQDTLLVVTPYKTYSMKSSALDRIPRQQIADQLKEKIRKDSWHGSAAYRDLLNEYQDLIYPAMPEVGTQRYALLMEVSQRFKDLKKFDQRKAEAFAEYLKDKKGQKHVFLFYQKEMFPIHMDEPNERFDAIDQEQLNTEWLRQIFADKSISCHFLYITKKTDATNNSSKPYYQSSDWYDMRPGTFEGMMALAEGTGGLTESSYDGGEAFKKALTASENYYIIFYSPQNYKSDGNFREIEVKIKEKGCSIHHRAGYFAD